MHHFTDRITHTTAFVTPDVEHWLEQKIALWIHHEESIHHGLLTPGTNPVITELHLAPEDGCRQIIIEVQRETFLC